MATTSSGTGEPHRMAASRGWHRHPAALHLPAVDALDEGIIRAPLGTRRAPRLPRPQRCVCLRLIEKTTPKRLPGIAGASRMDGAWALVFFAHIMAGNPDWQRWYDDNQANKELWRVCGFTTAPAWQTLYLRFAELEQERYVAAFTEAANEFVRVAAAAEPRALRFFHTDGTPMRYD